MAVIAYRAGRPVQQDSTDKWISGVVRVRLRFESEQGGMHEESVGSGFCTVAWPNCIVTARHLIRQPVAVASDRIQVRVEGTTSDGLQDARALGCAYLDDGDWDLGLVWLEKGIEPTLGREPMLPHPSEGAELATRVHGYPLGDSTLASFARKIRVSGHTLGYLDGPAVPGMSGGPVVFNNEVVGVQSQNRGNLGTATMLWFDGVLNECLQALKNVMP